MILTGLEEMESAIQSDLVDRRGIAARRFAHGIDRSRTGVRGSDRTATGSDIDRFCGLVSQRKTGNGIALRIGDRGNQILLNALRYDAFGASIAREILMDWGGRWRSSLPRTTIARGSR